MSPTQAIEIADRDGFCKLGQHAYLWKTCEATAHIKIEGHLTPYLLITDPHGWKQPVKVTSEYNASLIKACEARNDAK